MEEQITPQDEIGNPSPAWGENNEIPLVPVPKRTNTPYLDSIIDGTAFKNIPQQNPDGTWRYDIPKIQVMGQVEKDLTDHGDVIDNSHIQMSDGSSHEVKVTDVHSGYTDLEQVLSDLYMTVGDRDTLQGEGKLLKVIRKLQISIANNKCITDGEQ